MSTNVFLTFKQASLNSNQVDVLLHKGTEPPFSSETNVSLARGSYLCRLCGRALFRSSQKFISQCGWPSFDGEITGAIQRVSDKDGRRTEILCSRCKGHLGHVFIGEGLTSQNIRYCVNGMSLDFVTDLNVVDSDEVIVAGGCFWGVEALLAQEPGVVKTEVGYCGGHLEAPSYEQVCQGDSGHYEAVRLLFDKQKTTLEQVLKVFFECHDPFQSEGQGADIGNQYQSAVFYYNLGQKETAASLLEQLKHHGRLPATVLLAVRAFWAAEAYHQQYFEKNHQPISCHRRVKRFF
jgi:peptide methionine sulfoxide reductase msrA/msrB